MSEADRHLLGLVRLGDENGWSQFVSRFQVRLIAYATRQVGQVATAEDLVQDTFIGFLQSLNHYREQCELESFLFQILRRRIVDHYRRLGQNREFPACDYNSSESNPIRPDPIELVTSSVLSPSTYARRREQNEFDVNALAIAIEKLAIELQATSKFRDLMIAEGLFYAQLRSLEIAKILSITENEVAVVKRRLIDRLAKSIRSVTDEYSSESPSDSTATNLLTTVWEAMRPSCPKRTTLGKYTLRILPDDWNDFVKYHVETLGCTFCNANLVELETTSISSDFEIQRDRLFSSTIGFLARSQSSLP